MKAKELIELLQQGDPEALVLAHDEVEEYEVSEVLFYGPEEPNVVDQHLEYLRKYHDGVSNKAYVYIQ